MMRCFRRRPMGEVRLCLQAFSAFTLTATALHWVSLPALRRQLWRALSANVQLPESQRLPMPRVLRCAAVASKLTPMPATCLARALVVEALLAGTVMPCKCGSAYAAPSRSRLLPMRGWNMTEKSWSAAPNRLLASITSSRIGST